MEQRDEAKHGAESADLGAVEREPDSARVAWGIGPRRGRHGCLSTCELVAMQGPTTTAKGA
jgi:hypothetical protein